MIFTTSPAASRVPAHEHVQRALRGQVVSDVVATGSGRVLRAFVPLALSDGRARGAIELDQDYAPIAAAARRSSLLISAVLEGLLALLCVLLVPVLARAAARLRRQVHDLDWMASHDHLTGLLNRPGFRRVIDERTGGERQAGALLLFDLDRFHEVNETVGAGRGDDLLVQVAARVRDGFPGQPVARLGEDEFGLLLPAAAEDAQHSAAQRLLAVLADPLASTASSFASLRESGCPGGRGPRLRRNLVRRAGIALTAAKEDGREIAFYSATDDVATLGPRRGQRVAGGDRRGQLSVHYQPQADLATGAIRGVEALVRWQHPGAACSPPPSSSPRRNAGLIGEIGRFVLETSARQWQGWKALGSHSTSRSTSPPSICSTHDSRKRSKPCSNGTGCRRSTS